MNRRPVVLVLGVLLIIVVIIVLRVGCSSVTPYVPFEGLRQKSVIYDDWFQCPNGDGNDVRAYQLYPFDTGEWVKQMNASGEHWVRGPVNDRRYSKSFEWSDMVNSEGNNTPPHWPYNKWVKSKDFYFYLEDYEEFDKDMAGTVHHSSIWALDTKTYRLYFVSGSM